MYLYFHVHFPSILEIVRSSRETIDETHVFSRSLAKLVARKNSFSRFIERPRGRVKEMEGTTTVTVRLDGR